MFGTVEFDHVLAELAEAVRRRTVPQAARGAADL
jgi:hypothetical protein